MEAPGHVPSLPSPKSDSARHAKFFKESKLTYTSTTWRNAKLFVLACEKTQDRICM